MITFQVEFEGISRREKEEIKLVKVAINVFVFIKTHRNVVEILRMNRCHRMLLGFLLEFMKVLVQVSLTLASYVKTSK